MWLFQGVLNAGLQILLSIFGGWLCARLKLVDPEILSRQLNAFAMRAAFPAFIIHLLGIKTNLQDLQAWRALGVFILWVFIIHMACLLWHKLRGRKSTVQNLGINCLLLSTNNTGCIGWPVLIATVGRQGAALSMLLGVLFFVQLLPAAITCFEYHKFLLEHQESVATSALPATAAADAGKDQDLLPTTVDPGKKQPTGFPHEFRYCYWSNAEYVPSKASSTQLVPVDKAPARKSYPNYVEVHVEESHDEAESDHHCYGGGRSSSPSHSSSADGSSSSSNTGPAAAAAVQQRRQAGGSKAPGAEWWRSGSNKKPEALKRAKDSCDSLYTPFAGAAVSTKQADMQERPQVVQSPRPVSQLSNLTRRLSRGLGQGTAAVSAAASTAVAAAASTPVKLVRAASLRKQQQQQPQQQRQQPRSVYVPLLSGHDGPVSCGGAPSSSATAAAANHSDSSRYSSSSTGAGAVEMQSSNTTGQQQQQQVVQGGASGSTLGSRRNTIGLGEFAKAADSAVELHTMWQEGLPGKQQQQQQELDTPEQELSTVSAPIVPAGSVQTHNNSFINGVRVSSRTALLGPAAATAAALNGRAWAVKPTKLSSVAHGAATAAGAAGASCAGGLEQHQELPHRSCFGSFVKSHPLLCHITTVQLKSFHLWLNLIAIALSVSGARQYLDADSPAFLPALGWLDGVLGWFSSACIPVLLFANGVWMVGKDVFGGKKGQAQVTLLLFFKLALLPALMVGLTQLFGMRDSYGLSLVLLASCPLAPLAFLVCQQYGVGAELATSVTIQGVLLMLPQMMAIIKISQVARLYDVDMLKAV